jgi:hypothetical protein
MDNLRAAEAVIFALRRKAETHLAVGDVTEFQRLQNIINELQQKYGAVKGRGGKDNDARTA